MNDYLNPLRVFDARRPAGRLAFVLGYVYLLILALVITVIDWSLGADLSAYPPTSLSILGTIGVITLVLRRLKDMRSSGAWVLVTFVPVLNLFFFICLALIPGKPKTQEALSSASSQGPPE